MRQQEEALPEDRMERVLDAIIEGKPLTAGSGRGSHGKR